MQSSVEFALSVANVKQLERSIKKLARQFETDIAMEVQQMGARRAADLIRSNVESIPFKDGNVDGAEPADVRVGPDSATWVGSQIAYLEFGTGAAGASVPYPALAMAIAGYHQDPTKAKWVYKRGGRFYISSGLTPQAPVYKAAMQLRTETLIPIARAVVNRAVMQ